MRRLVTAALLSLIVLSGCVEGGNAGNTGGSEGGAATGDAQEPAALSALRIEVLERLSYEVIPALLDEFVAASKRLESAAASHGQAPGEATRGAARQAWVDAMDIWQRVELVQIGPLGAMGSVEGGQDLRDRIYSWPLTNPCRVDQKTADESYADEAALAKDLVNGRGLDALEALLFRDSPANACAPNAALNTSGTWAALGDAEVERRRAAYAAVAAKLVAADAVAARSAWGGASAGFGPDLGAPGPSRPYLMSGQEALERVVHALFYLDLATKDRKVAKPAGIKDCASASCPEAVESPFAGRSLEHVRANLDGFRLVFSGAPPGVDAPGIDDLLVLIGAGDTAAAVLEAIDAAVESAAMVPGDLGAAVTLEPQAVADLHQAIRDITDLLKTDLLSQLDLSAPETAAGDND
jgi:predicted lipoprotein